VIEKDNNLPGTWQSATIGELIGKNGVFIDGDWVESKDQDPNGDVRLIQLADIGDGIFRDKSARFLKKNKAYELRCTFLQSEDILIARMPEPLGRACIFPLIGEEKYVTVVDVCIVRPGHKDISNKYLTYAINSPQIRQKIEKYKTGSTRKRISRKNLARVDLPIAPLPEQHRIVAKIEQLFSELDKGVAELKKARENLELYRQSLLKAAFEGRLTEAWRKEHADELESADELLARIKAEREKRYQQQLDEWKQAVRKWEAQGKPGRKPTKPRKPKELPPLTKEELAELPELPKGWRWVRFGNIVENFKRGPFGSAIKKEFFVPKGIKVYEQKNAIYKSISLGDYYIDEDNFEELSQFSVGPNDYIVSCSGTVGEIYRLPENAPNGVINQALLRIRVSYSLASPAYFERYFSSNFFQRRILKDAKGSAMVNLAGVKELELVPFAITTMKEQKNIEKYVEIGLSNIDHLTQTIDTALSQADLLRQAILKKAFSGRLVPQDPNDEPASELLKRIKEEREKATQARVRATGRSPQRSPQRRQRK